MSAPSSPPVSEHALSPAYTLPEEPLPPLPPLQRAPGIKCTPAALVERGGASGTKIAVVANFLQAGNKMTVIGDGVSMFPVRLSSRAASDNDGVSRLVMKNVSKVTGKRKALIHSIPKFSQVLPNQQLAEAQRVLQERLLKKAGVASEAGEMKASSMLLTLVDRREKEAGGMARQVEETATGSQLLETDMGVHGRESDTEANQRETDMGVNIREMDMGVNPWLPDIGLNLQETDVRSTMGSKLQRIKNKQIHERETGRELQKNQMDINPRPRRERKPRKTAICHFLPSTTSPNLPSLSEVTITPRYQDQESTPTTPTYQNVERTIAYNNQDRTARYENPDSTTKYENEDRTTQYQDDDVGAPLDLCIRRTPTPEMIEVNCDPLVMSFGSDPNYNPETESNPSPSLDTGSDPSPGSDLSSPYIPILHPADYERLAGENPLYSTYIFLPSAGVFVHPLALPTELNPHLPTQLSSQLPQLPPQRKTFHVPPATTSFSLNGSTTVHRIKKQDNPAHTDHIPGPDHTNSLPPGFSSYKKLVPSRRRKRSSLFHQPSDNSGEVSICKFKFTGGARPSLEEKKMLSVDSGGNFRYYNGERSGKGFEFCSPASSHMKHNDRFSRITQDRVEEGKGRQKKVNLGAVDLIGAFESMPERTGRNMGDVGLGGQGKRGRKKDKAQEGHQVST